MRVVGVKNGQLLRLGAGEDREAQHQDHNPKEPRTPLIHEKSSFLKFGFLFCFERLAGGFHLSLGVKIIDPEA
jgi:hypothetical protein